MYSHSVCFATTATKNVIWKLVTQAQILTTTRQEKPRRNNQLVGQTNYSAHASEQDFVRTVLDMVCRGIMTGSEIFVAILPKKIRYGNECMEKSLIGTERSKISKISQMARLWRLRLLQVSRSVKSRKGKTGL